MIIRPPKNFKYCSDTENLFLFYQCINEMSFNYSPDSYQAPIMNTVSLCDEILQTYEILENGRLEEKLYKKYIPVIGDELQECICRDVVAKDLIGLRIESVKSSLNSLHNTNGMIVSTIRNIRNHYRNLVYIKALEDRLVELVTSPKSQQEIISTSGNWITELIRLGYSKEHIYHMTQDFFQRKPIESGSSILEFFQLFNFERKEWELLLLVDKQISPYIKELRKIISDERIVIEITDDRYLKELLNRDGNRHVNFFVNSYKTLQLTKRVACIKVRVKSLDPYCGLKEATRYIRTLMDIVELYDNEVKLIYPYSLCLNYSRTSIVSKTAMSKKNRIYAQSYLPETLKMLSNLRVSRSVLYKLLSVFRYHGDALAQSTNEKYVILMLWTSLEEFFIDGNIGGSKGSIVKNAIIEIIQRTIIIKRLKYLQNDLKRHLKANNKELIEKYKIDNLEEFIQILFMDESSEQVSEIMKTFATNPLLRSRIYSLINKSFSDGKNIMEFLDKHRKKIEYQIERIYRSRNLLVHTGVEMDYEEKTIECLHYYVDFVVNYIIAKCESGEPIYDIYDVVEEARNDNKGHMTILGEKKNVKTTQDNYKEMLFGPSSNILTYYSDHVV